MPEKFPLIEPADLQKMIPVYLGVESTLNDIEKPTPEFTQAVFESIVQLFVGSITFAYSSIQDMDFPELHVDSGPRLQFFVHIQNIFQRIKVKDFCFEDLVRPEKDRFIKHMSGVINFLKFRAERLNLLQNYEQNQLRIREEHTGLEKNLQAKEEDLKRLKEAYEEERKRAEALEPERQRRRQQCVHLSKQHSQLSQQHNSLRSTVNRLKDELDTTAFEFNGKVREKEEVQDLIVEPPDMIQKEIQTLNERLIEIRDLTSHLLSKDSELRTQIQLVSKYGSNIEGDMELLKEIEQAKEENHETTLTMQQMKQQLEEESQIYQNLVKEVENLSKAFMERSQQLVAEKDQFDLVQKELNGALYEKENEKSQAVEQNEETERSIISQGNNQVQQILEKTRILEEKHQDEMKKLQNKGELLEEKFLSWSHTIS